MAAAEAGVRRAAEPKVMSKSLYRTTGLAARPTLIQLIGSSRMSTPATYRLETWVG